MGAHRDETPRGLISVPRLMPVIAYVCKADIIQEDQDHVRRRRRSFLEAETKSYERRGKVHSLLVHSSTKSTQFIAGDNVIIQSSFYS